MTTKKNISNAVEQDKGNVSLQMAISIAQALGYPHEAFVEVFLNDMLKKSGINKIVQLRSKAA